MFRIHSLLIKKVSLLLFLLACYHSIIINKALANMEQAKLTCTISVNSTSIFPDKVMIDFSLKNLLNEKIIFSTWYTPFEGFLSDLFVITNTETGMQLEYLGPMVKRLAPEQEDFLSLTGEGTISTTLNIAQAYQFPPGRYQLKLKNNIFQIEGKDSTPSLLNCDSTAIIFDIKD